MEPEKAQDPGPVPSMAQLPAHAAYLSFAGSWFIQQESVRVGFKSVISLGRAKGVPQILGAGLGVGGRRGGDAAAPTPVPAGGATAAVRHVAALLPRVTGRAGSWAETRQRMLRGLIPQGPLQIPHGQPRAEARKL